MRCRQILLTAERFKLILMLVIAKDNSRICLISVERTIFMNSVLVNFIWNVLPMSEELRLVNRTRGYPITSVSNIWWALTYTIQRLMRNEIFSYKISNWSLFLSSNEKSPETVKFFYSTSGTPIHFIILTFYKNIGIIALWSLFQ